MKKTVIVTQKVEIEIDESKFNEEFMEEFRNSFYEFYTIEEHIEHLAQLYARGAISEWGDFIEGYGQSNEMGIKGKIEVEDVEIEN